MRSLLVVLFVLTFWFVGNAQIINFSDPNFKNALVNTKCVDNNSDGIGDADADFNNDGEIDKIEVLQIANLIVNSQNISNINGIENFYNLTYLNCSGNQLTTLKVNELLQLVRLDCGDNKLSEISVQGLSKLYSFSCFNNQLTNLHFEGLTNLTLINCNTNLLNSLNIQNLKNLTYLDCSKNQLEFLLIKNGRYFACFFSENPNLKYICCNDSNILNIKDQLLNYSIENCEVNSYCSFAPGAKFYSILGQNLYDDNNDGCNQQDIKPKNFKYNITNGSVNGSFISNATGYYHIPVQAGTHIITPILENIDHFEVTPAAFTITLPSTSDTITQDFCITPKGIFRQTNITVIPLSPPARPGFDAEYKIVWENAGNQIESGSLNFTYDETRLDYTAATAVADIVADGIVKWNFSDLRPFEKREIIVTFKVNRPTDTPAVNAGDKLYLNASILDNIFTLENTVVGSYDPNDKTCLQGERIHPDQIGKYVNFLIRFENTGNYAAENIVVKDIIDTKKFDVSSLQITDASHEASARIEGNKVEFIFEKIQLPFDDANNDGYIAFKIKTLPTLMVGDSLKNLADIYFDYNFPIRTNETKSKLAFPVGTNDLATDVKVYPNPVNDVLTFEINDDEIHKVEIYDIQGRIMRSSSIINNQLNLSELEQGSYVSKVYGQKVIGWVRFVKM